MSIYASSSDSYWKERQKKNEKKSSFLTAGIVILSFLAIAGSILYIQNKREPSLNTSTLTQRQDLQQTNETHWKQCESRVNSRQECTTICQPERNSIQRKTMHQACLHGCHHAHVASTALGCRGKVEEGKERRRKELSEEDVFQEIGVLAYEHCSKFQSVDPKPDAFATCRKYHRAGTKQGFRMGKDSMKYILDKEGEVIKAEK